MSETTPVIAPDTCPACRDPLREGARFCTRCGVEVLAPCPACGSSPRSLAITRRETSPWCPSCEALLDACELCGRWLPVGTGRCPDPQCGGRVLPFLAQHTGRRWDGRGSGVRRDWPLQWEPGHPQRTSPRVHSLPADDGLQALFLAHGRLVRWEGTTLVATSLPGWGTQRDAALPPDAVWRCPLGPAGRPASVPWSERVAIAGAAAVIAQERRFLLADLGGSGDSTVLDSGVPFRQVGGPGWWVGWSLSNGIPLLQGAAIGPTWDSLQPTRIETPAEAAPSDTARLVIRDGRVWWPSADGAIWQLECVTGVVKRVLDPAPGDLTLWAERDGVRCVREQQGNLVLGLSSPSDGRFTLSAQAGSGPLRGIYSCGEWIVAVGERVAVYDPVTATRLHDGVRPPGRWIDGALIRAADGEPRLLALVQEADEARLLAMRLSTGAMDELWRSSGVEPKSILAVEPAFWVAHGRGVVALL